MSATKSYLIPVGDLSLDDRRMLRKNSDEVLINNAIRLRIRDDENDFLLRDTLPNTDLGLAAQEDYLVAGAGIVATELQYFAPVLAQDRCIAFFGLGVESAAASISRVRLTLGAASAQARGVFQIEQLYSRLEPAGYFSEAVIFTRQETIRCMVMPRIAFVANSERLHFYAKTIEPIGAVVSAPSV